MKNKKSNQKKKIMKKTLGSLLVVASLVATPTLWAQKNKVLNAYNYNRSYEKSGKCSDLAKGIQEIEPATQHEQTMNMAKTWKYRGDLYFNIIVSQDNQCKQVAPDALDKAYESYIKALKLNFDNPELRQLDIENNKEDLMKFMMALMDKNNKFEDPSYTAEIIGAKFPVLSNAFINEGVNQFQQKQDYNKAYEMFAKGASVAQLTGKTDTLALYYAAIAAQKAGKNEEAKTIFEALTQLKYDGGGEGPKIYSFLAQIYKEEGNQEKYIETIQRGRKAYPNDKALILEELDYYLQKGENRQALNNLNLAIEKDPQNHVLYFARGTIYDKQGDIAKAEKDYLKAIELKSDYFDAIYNLGALYYNNGVEYNNKANDLPPSQVKQAKELQDKANAEFKKALPFLEKANQLQPDDMTVVQSLQKIYALTGDREKYNALKAKYSK